MTFAQFTAAIRSTGRVLMRNHTMPIAAGLAYYFVLSLFPLLIVLATVVVYLPIPNLFGRLLAALASVVPPEGMGLVRGVLRDVLTHQHPKLLSVGLVGTLYAASGGFSSMIEALNLAYDVPETRPWWRTRIVLSLRLTLVIGGLFVMAMAFMMVGPQFGGWLAGKIGLGPVFAFLWEYLRWAVAVGFTILGVLLLYLSAPNVQNRFWPTLPGAMLAVSTWLAGSWAFGLYIRHLANFNKTYGTLGAAVVLLTWLYWTNLIMLIGAEFNNELVKASTKRPLLVKAPAEKPQPTPIRRAA